jgi:hypothetical protein
MWVTRTVRARKVRAALGRTVAAAKGALGISSEIRAESGRERRTATSAPPAETFSAVANSRNSFPLSSRLRTNTGIASGRRGHLRRSVSGALGFKPTPWYDLPFVDRTLWAKPGVRLPSFQAKNQVPTRSFLASPPWQRHWLVLDSLYIRLEVWVSSIPGNTWRLQAFSLLGQFHCIFR